MPRRFRMQRQESLRGSWDPLAHPGAAFAIGVAARGSQPGQDKRLRWTYTNKGKNTSVLSADMS